MLRSIVTTLALVLLFSVGAVFAQDDAGLNLTIMHTNDTHAAHQPDGDGNGGVARQATVVNQIRGEVANSLLLDAGDRFSGTLFHTLYVGQDQVQIMNALGYDAMVLGNHEFDNGDDVLAEFVGGVEFPVLGANVDFSASPFLADMIEPYTILEVDGQQIGVIGIVTADTIEIASPGDELVWRDDYAAVVNEVAAELTDMGINKIVLLTHSGINVELPLLAQLSQVDLVLGGHSHTLFSNSYLGAYNEYPLEGTDADGQTIYYAQAGANNEYLGRLDIEFDADGVIADIEGDTILLSRYIAADETLDAIVADLAEEVEALRNEPTGAVAEVFLDGDRTVCRVEECNLGNIIADAMRAKGDADIAIMNAGGIRRDIAEGEITLGTVLELHPFGNQLATFDATGADIIAALENGVSRITLNASGQVQRSGASGRFPQVSGLRFSFDPNLEAGSRVLSVEVMNDAGEYEAIDPEAVYHVATNNFVRTGGDGYAMFAENAMNAYDFGPLDYEVTGEYMAEISPITVTVDPENPRITIVNAEVEPRS